MTITRPSTRFMPLSLRGFTVLEMLFVVVIIGLLAAIALPQYQGYRARSQATELALKFDAIRTHMQIVAKTGEVQTACATVASTVPAGNLQSEFAQLAINFEPTAGGFSPVLTLCASSATQGHHGVEVTREAHNLLSRNSVISQGAVIGESAVSFSVKLADEVALCRKLPVGGGNQGACSSSMTTVPQSDTTIPTTVKPPQVAASNPSPAASTPVPSASISLASATLPVPSVVQPAGILGACRGRPTKHVDRPVIRFGESGRAYITSTSPVPTGGNLRALTAEVVIAGGQTPGNNLGAATLLSYYIPGSGVVPASELSLWNPSSLHITFPGGRGVAEFDTGVNVDDGKSHRVTMSWQASDGALVLYDNGLAVWRQSNVNTNGALPGNGQLVVGQAAPSGTEYRFSNGYRGSIANAALASKAITADQVASAPLHTVLSPNSGLLTDMEIGPYSLPFDTTSNTRYVARGSDFTAQSMPIDPTVYVDENCQ